MIRRFALLQTFVAVAPAGKMKRAANELALTPGVRQDAYDFSLDSFTHAYPVVTNGRFEAASRPPCVEGAMRFTASRNLPAAIVGHQRQRLSASRTSRSMLALAVTETS